MFFALWDGEARTLAYSNAGHFPPILMRDAEVMRLTSGGLPIGMFPVSGYGEDLRQLEPGDLLVMFTDGVIEAPNPEGSEFGEARLVEILTRHHDVALETLMDRVIDAVAGWKGAGPPHDDVTLVLARVH
jgi:sigma-B regulation protein RsbU (phosphoserine phosphatase)